MSKTSPPRSDARPSESDRARILVAEDDEALRNLLVMSLEARGYQVFAATDGIQALDLFLREPIDLVLLDIMMPRMSGLDVLDEIRRRSDVPVIMITALNRPDDVVAGLNRGADDYITKPFLFKEVEARVSAALRRLRWQREGRPAALLRGCGVRVDAATREVTVNGRPVDLTPTEFDLLYHLMSHRGRAIAKDDLFRDVWGYDDPSASNVVEVTVRRLRAKIEDDPAHPRRILTVRGVGYKFAGPTECEDTEGGKD